MILDKVRSTSKTYGLLPRGETVVIGVSGGPDSLALLYILSSLKNELGIRLHVAHLDHGLRKSSSADLKYVGGQAGALGITFTGKRIKPEKPSEEACRQARLDFLFSVAKKQNAKVIALGHTLDDQAETVLMRLIRGTGLLGLAAIAPRREFGGYTLVRPLIEVTRREIEAYLRRKKLEPRTDETNVQDIYLRNRVRKELLPLLEKKYNRNIKEILGNTAYNAGYDYDYLTRSAQKAAGKIGTAIGLRRLIVLHPALKRTILRLMAAKAQGSTRRLTARHIREIEDMVLNRPAGSIVDLPNDISVVKTAKTVRFYRRRPKQATS